MTDKTKKDSWYSIIITVLIALLIRVFIIEPYSIPSGSMKPNYLVGDYLFVSKFDYGFSNASFPFEPNIFNGRFFKYNEPKRGDVIVFKSPHNRYTNYIKRLIGLPGDKIQLINSEIYINNHKMQRKYIGEFTDTDGKKLLKFDETLDNGVHYSVLEDTTSGNFKNTAVYEVPKNHYFFMGDNRDHSADSRFGPNPIGFVSEDKLIGKALLIVFSNPYSITDFKNWFTGFNFSRLLEFAK